MLPWSVIPIAGMSSRFASANIGATFAAPSSIEYSVWLWRCTNELLIGPPVYGRAPPVLGVSRAVSSCVSGHRHGVQQAMRKDSAELLGYQHHVRRIVDETGVEAHAPRHRVQHVDDGPRRGARWQLAARDRLDH